MRSMLRLLSVIPALLLFLPQPSFAVEEEAAAIVAAQLQRQGITCTKPRQATRDTKSSTANEVVWTIRCDEAAYRVTLVPRMKARVTPVK